MLIGLTLQLHHKTTSENDSAPLDHMSSLNPMPSLHCSTTQCHSWPSRLTQRELTHQSLGVELCQHVLHTAMRARNFQEGNTCALPAHDLFPAHRECLLSVIMPLPGPDGPAPPTCMVLSQPSSKSSSMDHSRRAMRRMQVIRICACRGHSHARTSGTLA